MRWILTSAQIGNKITTTTKITPNSLHINSYLLRQISIHIFHFTNTIYYVRYSINRMYSICPLLSTAHPLSLFTLGSIVASHFKSSKLTTTWAKMDALSFIHQLASLFIVYNYILYNMLPLFFSSFFLIRIINFSYAFICVNKTAHANFY